MRDIFAPRCRLILVPGLHGSGEGHWQQAWRGRVPDAIWVDQDDPSTPELEVWTRRLKTRLETLDVPAVVAAHSFGALTTLRLMQQGESKIAAALLVAPANPNKFQIHELLSHPVSTSATLMVVSDNDPWMKIEHAHTWARQWRVSMINIGSAGHINAESNLGRWDAGWAMLQQLVAQWREGLHREAP